MQRSVVFLKFWLPVLIWMAVIFTGSSDAHSYQHSSRLFEPLLRWLFPQMSPNGIESIHHAFRKCCHLAEYAIFSALIFRALIFSNLFSSRPRARLFVTLLGIFLYAASDEFHQRFVPTRTAHFTDVLIDTAGGALGLLLYSFFQNLQKTQSQK